MSDSKFTTIAPKYQEILINDDKLNKSDKEQKEQENCCCKCCYDCCTSLLDSGCCFFCGIFLMLNQK
jgi:hypothetical protein